MITLKLGWDPNTWQLGGMSGRSEGSEYAESYLFVAKELLAQHIGEYIWASDWLYMANSADDVPDPKTGIRAALITEKVVNDLPWPSGKIGIVTRGYYRSRYGREEKW